ncbi:MAG: hypothetical protein R3D56_16935 [Paracoccaceae bacterium]
MKRTLLITLFSLASLASGAALAADLVDTILSDLRQQGYDEIEVSRTLLGRTRIEAESAAYHREIIVNPRTGEILRDYWELIGSDGNTASNGPLPGPVSPGVTGTSGSNSGPGSSNSGSGGSGSSGSGSSGSGSSSGSGGSGSGGSGSGGSGSGDDDDDD